MSVKRTLNRGLNALVAVAKNLLSATSIGDAHKRPERGAGRSTTPMGNGRWGRGQSPPEGGCNGSSDTENNARARGRTPGTRQSWLRMISRTAKGVMKYDTLAVKHTNKDIYEYFNDEGYGYKAV